MNIAPAQQVKSDPAAGDSNTRANRFFGEVLPEHIWRLSTRKVIFDRQRHGRVDPEWSRVPDGYPPAHSHSRLEICFVLKGDCPFLLGEQHFIATAGDLVLLSPDVFHRECAAEEAEPYELFWLGFGSDNIRTHLQEHLGGGKFRSDAFDIQIGNVPQGMQLAKAIDLELRVSSPGVIRKIQGFLLQLCGCLQAGLSSPQETLDSSNSPERKIRAAVEYIRGNFKHPLDLKEVAHFVGLNPNYLSTIFTPAIGLTFCEFVNTCRIAEAERLMGSPALSIKEIAARVGVSNQFYFSRMFRKYTGVSPTSYRSRRSNVGQVITG